MAFLDTDNSGTIDMSEFLVGIRVINIFLFVNVFRENLIKEDKWLLIKPF